jgi:murein biosynthesis integral membrane protein MurJ
MLRAILFSALLLNFGLLLGRLSGFFREALVAANFGVSFQADIVVLMLTVPDLMVTLLVGGAMGAVMVPLFSNSKSDAYALFYQATIFFGFVFSIVTALLIWQVELLLSFLVPGFDPEQIRIAATNVQLVLWSIPLTVVAGISTAFLHSRNKFLVASLGTLLVNGAIIVGLYLSMAGLITVLHIGFCVLVGGLLRYISQLLSVRAPLNWKRIIRTLLLDRIVFTRYGQAMVSGSLLFVFPVLARAFASFEDAGSVALLNYSMRLVELPMGVGISFLAVVLFPRLSESFQSNVEQHREYIRYGMQITVMLALIATILLVILSRDYAGLVYSYGDMSSENVAAVAALIAVGLLVLPFQGLAIYNTAVFNSRTDTRTPMIINSVGLLLFLCILKFDVLGGGLSGIMRGLVTSFAVIAGLQLVVLRIERLKMSDIFLDRAFLAGGACATLISCLLGLWIEELHQSAIIKIIMGMMSAVVGLTVMALFYAEVRGRIRALISGGS